MRPGCGVRTGRARCGTSSPSSAAAAGTRRCGWRRRGSPARTGGRAARRRGRSRSRCGRARRCRRGASVRVGARCGVGARPAARPARCRGRLDRVRGAAPGRRRGVAPLSPCPPRPDRPAARGAGADDHRAEGHRPGGVLRLPRTRAGVRRARARAGCGRRTPPPARCRDPGGHPVVGVARAAHRPGAIAGRRHCRAARRCASSGSSSVPRTRPRTSTARSAASRASACGPAPRPGNVRWGTRDAVSFGDFHVAKDVGWALVGREIDDRELSEVLEPWRPHRGRVPLLLGAARIRRPRRGHRASLRGHLPHV